MRSARRRRALARRLGLASRQPSRKARSASRTAASTSAAPPAAAWPTTSPVPGSNTSNVSPLAASRRWPLITMLSRLDRTWARSESGRTVVIGVIPSLSVSEMTPTLRCNSQPCQGCDLKRPSSAWPCGRRRAEAPCRPPARVVPSRRRAPPPGRPASRRSPVLSAGRPRTRTSAGRRGDSTPRSGFRRWRRQCRIRRGRRRHRGRCFH